MPRVSPYPMVPVPEAVEIILSEVEKLPPTTVPTHEAVGKILAVDVTAHEPVPPFDASLMDGYAVIASDGKGVYPVIEQVTAGNMPDVIVTPGKVAYITTGSPVPQGATAVIKVELTEKMDDADGAKVELLEPAKEGQSIRRCGSDIAKGEVVLKAGSIVGPAEVGLLATVGVTTVPVVRPPRVGVMSTGDEVVEYSVAEPAPGKIRDSNRVMLLTALRQCGAETTDVGICGDKQENLKSMLFKALEENDVVVTSGGVSMGELDLIKPILEKEGKVHFGRVLMKPGKPLTFATVNVKNQKRFVFALPGNPVSSLVTFHLAAVPALRKLGGHANPYLKRISRVRVTKDLKLDPERPEYHRAEVRWSEEEGNFVAESTGSQASSRLLSMYGANALLELPQQSGTIPAGDFVTALLVGTLQ